MKRAESTVCLRADKMDDLSSTDKILTIQMQCEVISQFIKSTAPVIKSALETSRAVDSEFGDDAAVVSVTSPPERSGAPSPLATWGSSAMQVNLWLYITERLRM